MPEFRECYAHYLMANHFWSRYGNTSDFRLLAMWADRSSNENQSGHGVEAVSDKEAYVSRIDGSFSYTRGNQYHQTPLYPTHEQLLFAATALEITSSPTLSVLSLQGIEHTARSLILNFGTLYFQLSFLTHTSVQIYTREQWESSIQVAQKQHRKFKIAVCFEFRDYFFAFPSHDMLIQPIWGNYPASARFGVEIPYVWDDFDSFLKKVVSWAEPLLKKSSCVCALAISEIVKAEEIWPGVGVYTSSELFFDAGISPFVSLYELISVPSRLARLACAYLSFALKSRDDLWDDLLQPAMIEGILAPTLEQRLKYKNWLHVWAKPKVRVTSRMKHMISSYTTKLESALELSAMFDDDPAFRMTLFDLNDPFEPNLIRAGLDAAPYLGTTIFGNAWAMIEGRPTVPPAIEGTPNLLDQMYSRVQKTAYVVNVHIYPFLNMDHYKQLYVELTPTSCKYANTLAFRSSKRPIWTVLPPLTPNIKIIPAIASSGGNSARNIRTPAASIYRYTDAELKQSYFEAVVSGTEGVAIGPLEYCGNGQVHKDSHQKLVLRIIPLDPRLKESEIVKISKKAHRKKLSRKSSLKAGMTLSQAEKRNSQVKSDIVAYHNHRDARSASVSSHSSHSSWPYDLDDNEAHPADSVKEDEDEDNNYNKYSKYSLPHTPPSHGEDDEEDIPAAKKRRRMSQDQRLASELMGMTASGSGLVDAAD